MNSRLVSTLLLCLCVCQLVVLVASTWFEESVPDTTLNYVSAAWLSASVVLMGGNSFQFGNVLKSTDGGITWTTKLTGVNPIYDIAIRNISNVPHVVAVTSNGDVYYSWNAGENWRTNVTVSASLYGVTIGPGPSGNAYAVGILVSASAVYKSTASSHYATWTLVSSSLSATKQLNGVCSYDGTIVVAVATSGGIYASGNGGSTWSTRASGTTADLYGVVCPSSTVVYAAGTSAVLLVSKNSGATWSSLSGFTGLGTLTSSSSFMLHSVTAPTSTVIYLASQDGTIVKSSNSGSSWSLEATESNSLYCVAAYDSTLAVAGSVGTEYTRLHGELFVCCPEAFLSM
jgi:photosystem II stability/assembly factor-like uncharacterized protein